MPGDNPNLWRFYCDGNRSAGAVDIQVKDKRSVSGGMGKDRTDHFHTPRSRSLIALHSAIGYTVMGNPSYAKRGNALLRDFAHAAPAQSIEDLEHSCQAYALASDRIHPALLPKRRIEIEGELFDYAKPLFGASHYWISNTDISSMIANRQHNVVISGSGSLFS